MYIYIKYRKYRNMRLIKNLNMYLTYRILEKNKLAGVYQKHF